MHTHKDTSRTLHTFTCYTTIHAHTHKTKHTYNSLSRPPASSSAAGVSRSVSVVMAFLMATEDLKPAEAYRSIKKVNRRAKYVSTLCGRL